MPPSSSLGRPKSERAPRSSPLAASHLRSAVTPNNVRIPQSKFLALIDGERKHLPPKPRPNAFGPPICIVSSDVSYDAPNAKKNLKMATRTLSAYRRREEKLKEYMHGIDENKLHRLMTERILANQEGINMANEISERAQLATLSEKMQMIEWAFDQVGGILTTTQLKNVLQGMGVSVSHANRTIAMFEDDNEEDATVWWKQFESAVKALQSKYPPKDIPDSRDEDITENSSEKGETIDEHTSENDERISEILERDCDGSNISTARLQDKLERRAHLVARALTRQRRAVQFRALATRRGFCKRWTPRGGMMY